MIGIKDQYFGVEVEMTGLTREDAARTLAEYFGTRAKHIGGTYDAWEVKDLEGQTWKLMYDSSIHAERLEGGRWRDVGSSHYKVEMVTPKLSYGELPKMQECIRRLRRAGAKVNDSCGLHVHNVST